MKKYMVIFKDAHGAYDAQFFDDFICAVNCRLIKEDRGCYAELYSRYPGSGYELIG